MSYEVAIICIFECQCLTFIDDIVAIDHAPFAFYFIYVVMVIWFLFILFQFPFFFFFILVSNFQPLFREEKYLNL